MRSGVPSIFVRSSTTHTPTTRTRRLTPFESGVRESTGETEEDGEGEETIPKQESCELPSNPRSTTHAAVASAHGWWLTDRLCLLDLRRLGRVRDEERGGDDRHLRGGVKEERVPNTEWTCGGTCNKELGLAARSMILHKKRHPLVSSFIRGAWLLSWSIALKLNERIGRFRPVRWVAVAVLPVLSQSLLPWPTRRSAASE